MEPNLPDSKPAVHTYVLIGPRNETEKKLYAENTKDYTSLVVGGGDSFEKIIAKIDLPANLVMQFHGNPDSGFEWSTKEGGKYRDFLAALPRTGIQSIMLNCCFSGSAEKEEVLRAAPPGTLVMSMIGAYNVGLNHQTIQFAREAKGLTNPIDLYLETLDNFNPTSYKETVEYLNKRYSHKDNSNPEQAMPAIIGIGGNSPLLIDLNNEIQHLPTGQNFTADAAMKRAIARVKERFDTDYIRANMTDNTIIEGGHGAKAEAALDKTIEAVALKLQDPTARQHLSVEEKRIAFGIAAAYLDESKQLQKRIDQVVANSQSGIGSATELIHHIDGGGNPRKADGVITQEEVTDYMSRVNKIKTTVPELLHAQEAMASKLGGFVRLNGGNPEKVTPGFTDLLYSVAGTRNEFGGVNIDAAEMANLTVRNAMLTRLLAKEGFTIPDQGMPVKDFQNAMTGNLPGQNGAGTAPAPTPAKPR